MTRLDRWNVCQCCVKCSQSCCDWNGHVHRPHYHENYFQFIRLDLLYFTLRWGWAKHEWERWRQICNACANNAFSMHVITTASTSHGSVFSALLFTLFGSVLALWPSSIYCFDLLCLLFFFWLFQVEYCPFLVVLLFDFQMILIRYLLLWAINWEVSLLYSTNYWTTLFHRWYELIIVETKETIM